MTIHTIDATNPHWVPVSHYGDACSWDACARMATFMREGAFTDWERVFVAEKDGNYMGFCALVKPQAFPGVQYGPLLKWVYVSEAYRGKRLSQALIEAACRYTAEIGYHQIYLTTWHTGLYEKYGFVKLCDKQVRDGYYEGIYVKQLTRA